MFSLISNKDYLKIKIDENFFFEEKLGNEDKKIQDKLLELLYTHPLDSRLMPTEMNEILLQEQSRPVVVKLDAHSCKNLDYLMKNPKKIYWIKSSLNNLYIGQRLEDKINFTNDIPHAEKNYPAFA